jgi:hypothetical protein
MFLALQDTIVSSSVSWGGRCAILSSNCSFAFFLGDDGTLPEFHEDSVTDFKYNKSAYCAENRKYTLLHLKRIFVGSVCAEQNGLGLPCELIERSRAIQRYFCTSTLHYSSYRTRSAILLLWPTPLASYCRKLNHMFLVANHCSVAPSRGFDNGIKCLKDICCRSNNAPEHAGVAPATLLSTSSLQHVLAYGRYA